MIITETTTAEPLPILAQVITDLAAERDQAIKERDEMRTTLELVTGRKWN